MVRDHFLGAKFCRLVERNLLVKPWRLNHPLLVFLHISRGVRNQKTHTVDQPKLHRLPFSQRHLQCILRNKLRLHRSDQFSGTAQRQRVPYLRLLLRRKLRQRQHLHKPPDKRRFPGPHRSHDSNQKLSVCPGLYISVNRKRIHPNFPPCPEICTCGIQLNFFADLDVTSYRSAITLCWNERNSNYCYTICSRNSGYTRESIKQAVSFPP